MKHLLTIGLLLWPLVGWAGEPSMDLLKRIMTGDDFIPLVTMSIEASQDQAVWVPIVCQPSRIGFMPKRPPVTELEPGRRYTCNLDGWQFVRYRTLDISSKSVETQPQPDCLATMEQAMRAMEPFLSGENWQRELDILTAIRQNDLGEYLESRNSLLQRRNKAYEHWAEAKTCWGNKP